MLTKIKEFFLGKPKAQASVAEAPYKIETPSTDWPFPKATEVAPEPAPVATTAPAKKPRVPVKPKTASAEKPVTVKKPRAKKAPAK
jgi:hypothetical protein